MKIGYRHMSKSCVAMLAAAVFVLTAAFAAGCEDPGKGDERPETASLKPQRFTPVVASTLGAETAPVKGTDGKFHVVYDRAGRLPAPVRRRLLRLTGSGTGHAVAQAGLARGR